MKLFGPIFFLLYVVFSIACGSSGSVGNSSDNATASNVNPTTDGNVVPAVPQPVTNMNANANGVIDPKNNRQLTDARAETVKPTMTQGPDDSEYNTVMNKEGMPVETRIFRTDPQIARIVRTWQSVKDKKITVYLRNGKTVGLPGDKFENINIVSVNSIREAVGLKPPAPPPAAPGQPNPKKAQ
jgi:hypothetical protein